MKFKYAGTTRDGRRVSGDLEVSSEAEAKLRLRAMQVRPSSLVESKEGAGLFGSGKKKSDSATGGTAKKAGSITISIGPPINLKGMMIFTRQFSSLIDSGIAIVQCLDILEKQEKRPAFRAILQQVKADIETGSGLAESLARHPRAFSEFFIRIIEAGEISGTLDQALRRVGAQLEKLGKLKSKVIGALTYPTITVVVSIVVLVFLLVKVIPEVAQLYTQSNAKLPEITQSVLDLSAWVQANYLSGLLGLGVLIFGGSALYKMPGFRVVFDPFLLKVPLFGPLVKKSAVARFTRTMSTLIQSGVPLLNAFEICKKLTGNVAIRKLIEQASAAVSEGKSIAGGLAEGGIFPPMVIHMVSIGEMTGRLDELLGKVADIFDDEVDDAISAITGLIQPALIVIVGIMIAGLLLAMYLPIFQLAEKASGA